MTIEIDDLPRLPTFEIKVEGNAIPDGLPVASIRTVSSDARDLQLIVTIPFDLVEGCAIDKPMEAFPEGARVSLSLGWDGSQTVVFDGKIAQRKFSLGNGGDGKLLVEAYGTNPASGSGVSATTGLDVVAAYLSDQAEREPAGNVVIVGNSNATLGQKITLGGFGEAWDGDRTITAVDHAMDEGSWTTDVYIG